MRCPTQFGLLGINSEHQKAPKLSGIANQARDHEDCKTQACTQTRRIEPTRQFSVRPGLLCWGGNCTQIEPEPLCNS